MANAQHNQRPNRESLSKRLGRVVLRIAARDGHACVYCGATATSSGAALHLDHLLPRSRGGEDVAGNLVLACRRCNSRRQDKSLAEWARLSGGAFSWQSIRAQARRPLPALSPRDAR